MCFYLPFRFYYFKDKKQVENVSNLLPAADLTIMLTLADKRKTNGKQIWISGCSISHGCDIPTDLRYGQLIANALELPVSFLTHNAASIEWAADQIIRSDIRKNDIVIWGLTSFPRVPFFKNKKVNHITPAYYQKNPNFKNELSIDLLTNENSIYRNISAIHRVVNYCTKIKATIVIAGILIDRYSLPYVMDLPNFIQLNGLHIIGNPINYIDLGSDNSHPGVKTHKWYAEEILEKIRKC
jgi:hypothetical protein